MQRLDHPNDIANWLRQRVKGGLLCDSRQLQAGDGFVAWPGAVADGRQFVRAALASGALAAVVEHSGAEVFELDPERVLAVSGLKRQAGAIASAFYGEPSASLDVVAITGTNGKTSTAWWVAQLLSGLKMPCAVVGTLGIGRPPLAADAAPALVPTGLTTPDPVLLQSRLRALLNEGVQACAIEASSIGLVEGRLNATQIRVAVFTNFTQDHLDFHGDMDAYWQAKAGLFEWPGLLAAVVNLDDPKGVELASAVAGRGLDVWTVSLNDAAQARLAATGVQHTANGMRFQLVERDASGAEVQRFDLSLPLVGRYNASNVLCALASARALGFGLSQAVDACAVLTAVPGRMEQVGAASVDAPLVLVDYAHTPDALEKALQALQPVVRERQGALWVVVGCGGDRDASKRPVMAAVAEREAQRVVLTSDDPRSEAPDRILAQMAKGLARPAEATLEVDRAKAIVWAVQGASARDVVLIAGKGHEDYQEISGVKRPFADVAHASAALDSRAAAQGAQA